MKSKQKKRVKVILLPLLVLIIAIVTTSELKNNSTVSSEIELSSKNEHIAHSNILIFNDFISYFSKLSEQITK